MSKGVKTGVYKYVIIIVFDIISLTILLDIKEHK